MKIRRLMMSAVLAVKKTTIGGQALIEGLLMIGPDKRAMAVRTSSGEIKVIQLAPIKISKTSKWPFVRGSVKLFRQLVSGTKALMRSAELAEENQQNTSDKKAAAEAEDQAVQSDTADAGDQEATAAELAEENQQNTSDKKAAAEAEDQVVQSDSAIAGDQETTAAEDQVAATVKKKSFLSRLSDAVDRWIEKHNDAAMVITAVFGILFSIALFILLPNLLASFVRQLAVIENMSGRGATIILNLVEGLIRITIFVLYLVLTSRLKDIRRVWMYHGAEHKTIACYEDGKALCVDHVREYSRFHPRCGTAFLFIVILVSIVVFSLVGWWNRWLNLLIRFALVPLVAGIAYEIIRLAGRYDNKFTRFISAPGLWLQRFTTAEPDDSILEVAIAAMNAVRPEADNSDKW